MPPTTPQQSSTATAERYAKLLERLVDGANHHDYPEAFGGSWTQLCLEAAGAIRTLSRAAAQGQSERGEAAQQLQARKNISLDIAADINGLMDDYISIPSAEALRRSYAEVALRGALWDNKAGIVSLLMAFAKEPTQPTQGGDKGEARWEYSDGSLFRDGVNVFHFRFTETQQALIAELVRDANTAPQPASNAYAAKQPVAAALARRLCQLFDSGGESQRSVRARHASAIFQLLMDETPEQFSECEKCDTDPVGYLEAAESGALRPRDL